MRRERSGFIFVWVAWLGSWVIVPQWCLLCLWSFLFVRGGFRFANLLGCFLFLRVCVLELAFADVLRGSILDISFQFGGVTSWKTIRWLWASNLVDIGLPAEVHVHCVVKFFYTFFFDNFLYEAVHIVFYFAADFCYLPLSAFWLMAWTFHCPTAKNSSNNRQCQHSAVHLILRCKESLIASFFSRVCTSHENASDRSECHV